MTKEEALELLTQKGFMAAYFRRLGIYPDKSSVEVYESLESDYREHFGMRRYRNYDSFRQLKIRYLRLLKCK